MAAFATISLSVAAPVANVVYAADHAQTMAEAKEKYDEAVAQAQAGSPEYKDAVAKVEAAQSEVDNAKSAMDQASIIYQNAQKKVSDLKNQIQACENDEALANLNVELVNAESAAAQAKADYDNAVAVETEKESVLNKAKLAEAAKQTALETMNTANQTYEQAKADTVLAEQEKQDAIDQVVAEKTNVDKAQEQVNTAQKALDTLNNAGLNKYTIKGDPNDATSLENMKIALDTLKRYYEILDREELQHSKISDRGMAIAQSNANASAHSHGHTGQFTWTENLAWGYKPTNPEGFNDPYIGWYDKEKVNYENGVKDPMAIGHYLTIISDYSVTGIAYGRVTHSQVFGGGHSVESDPLFTYEEYNARFMNYYNSLMNAPTITEAAQKKLDEAKAALDSAKSVYYKAVSDAQKAVSKAKQEYEDAKATTNTLKEDTDNKEAAFMNLLPKASTSDIYNPDSKVGAVDEAKARLTLAEEELDKVLLSKEVLSEELRFAENEVQDKKDLIEHFDFLLI